MKGKQIIAKKALLSLYAEVHEAIADKIRIIVLEAFDEIREETIQECKEVLVNESNSLTYDTGQSVGFIPVSVILKLETLIR